MDYVVQETKLKSTYWVTVSLALSGLFVEHFKVEHSWSTQSYFFASRSHPIQNKIKEEVRFLVCSWVTGHAPLPQKKMQVTTSKVPVQPRVAEVQLGVMPEGLSRSLPLPGGASVQDQGQW